MNPTEALAAILGTVPTCPFVGKGGWRCGLPTGHSPANRHGQLAMRWFGPNEAE